MENQTLDQFSKHKPPKKDYALSVSILLSAIILSGTWLYTTEPPMRVKNRTIAPAEVEKIQISELEKAVLPTKGVVLPVTWGDLGQKLASVGAIDAEKFKALYEERNAFTEEYEKLLFGSDNGNLVITEKNSGFILNLLWALGLASKNEILDEGEMSDPRYSGGKKPASTFASTAGWTMANGDPMDHYSRHLFFSLTLEQQSLVDKVSRGIYRPCCGNSTHFPDCNHGMAMLGLLELMASQGVSEENIWKTALAVNSYWFPDTYLTIATYMKSKGILWKDVNPKEILGVNYSSSQGYAKIVSQVAEPEGQRGGSGCGVEPGGAPTVQSQQRKPSGCGI